MDDIKLPPLPEPHWPRGYHGSVPSGGYTKDQMHEYARAALAAAPAPPEPMSVLTDKDIMKAAVSWREFDAPDECGPVDRMVYGACRAVLAAYHAALQSKEQSNG